MSLKSLTRDIQQAVGATPDGIYGPLTAAAILRALRAPRDEPSGPIPPTVDEALDERTLRNLRTLEPKAQKLFEKFIPHAKAIAASLGCDYVAISGTRGKAEQDALYARGRTAPGPRVTNARYGYSNHNFGIALDFGVFDEGRYLDSDDPGRAARVHRAVANVADEYGIEWGGDWTSFKDFPHFEVATDLPTSEKRRRLFANQPILD